MIGPVTSVGASAVTQLSSSSTSVGLDCVLMRAVDEGSSFSRCEVVCLRFLDFLSPLKARGLTIVVSV